MTGWRQRLNACVVPKTATPMKSSHYMYLPWTVLTRQQDPRPYSLFRRPRHPYTRMLLDAIPDLEMTGRQRIPVAGEVPNPIAPPSGCHFHPRCPFAEDRCRREAPRPIAVDGGQVACHAAEEGRLPNVEIKGAPKLPG